MLLCVDRILPSPYSELHSRVKNYQEFLHVIRMLQSGYGNAQDALQVITPVLEKQLESLVFSNTSSVIKEWSDLVVHSPSTYLKLIRLLDDFFSSSWSLSIEPEKDANFQSFTFCL